MDIKRSYRIINTVSQAETWVSGNDNVALHAFLSTQTDACYVELITEQRHGSFYPVATIQKLLVPVSIDNFVSTTENARQWYVKK